MKKQDLEKLHQATVEQLNKELTERLFELANMRLQKKAGKLDSPSKLKVLSDNIARRNPIITEKQK